MSTFHKVGTTDELAPGEMKAVEVEGKEILLVNLDGEFYAIDNICAHAGGSLVEGFLEGEEVECPLHGSRFNVKTGELDLPPAYEPQTTFEVRLDESDILVKVDD